VKESPLATNGNTDAEMKYVPEMPTGLVCATLDRRAKSSPRRFPEVLAVPEILVGPEVLAALVDLMVFGVPDCPGFLAVPEVLLRSS
jgi:hypothetical protein